MSTQPPVDVDTTTPVPPQHVAFGTLGTTEPSLAPAYGVPQAEPKDVGLEEWVHDLPPLAQAGVDLAKWVLVIVSVFMLVALAVLVWSEGKSLSLAETSYSQLSNPGTSTETATAVKELIDQIDAQRKAFREFWHEFAQMVLLNLLLPVLTAILGYVFGSREGK